MAESESCLTLLGTASIQQYLFRTNRLKENLGASWLVADALNRWDREPWRQRYEQKIFIGGRTAALIFKNGQVARRAVEDWSLNLYRNDPNKERLGAEAPGLRVLAA